MKGKPMRQMVTWLGVLLLLAGGCSAPPTLVPQATSFAQPTTSPTPQPTSTLPPATKTPTPPPPTASPRPRPTATKTPTPCQITSSHDVILYNRPFITATVFSTLKAGDSIEASARTEDHWYGFDPGIAQAANIGVFRLRWIRDDGTLTLSGDCDRLPTIVGPPPGICFFMPMDDVDVHTEPDPSSEVTGHLTVGDYAAVIGKGPGWTLIDLSQGNTGEDVQGWVPTDALNVNCPGGEIPTLEP